MRRSRTKLAAQRFALPRSARLCRPSEVRRLYRARGSRWHSGLRVSGLPAVGASASLPSRIAVTAVRGFRNAVNRNHAKRLARESIRQMRAALVHGHDIMVMVRPQMLRCSSTEVTLHLRSALRGAALLDGEHLR